LEATMKELITRVSDTPGFADLVAAAVAAGTPAAVAADAARIAAQRFCTGQGGRPGARASAYYWGIVRRRALAGAAPRITRSLVITSLALELSDAGHSPEAIRREVARLHGDVAAKTAAASVCHGGQAA
jgi:hypothetical protein